jgi:hypothetical protein
MGHVREGEVSAGVNTSCHNDAVRGDLKPPCGGQGYTSRAPPQSICDLCQVQAVCTTLCTLLATGGARPRQTSLQP